MKPLYIETQLISPLAFSPSEIFSVSLDSLLMRVIADTEAKSNQASVWQEQFTGPAPDLPLARVRVGGREVWAGSIGFPVGPVKWEPFVWTKRWTGERRWVPPKKENSRDRNPWRPSVGSGYYRDRLDVYYSLAVPKVRFYGCGDIDAVKSLLQKVIAIGHKRNRGHGRALSWNAYPIKCDHSIWLRTQDAVYPARILPLSALNEEPDAIHMVAAGSVDPPHWLRETREEALFPPPFLWQEGLRDGNPESPEPNPCPDFGAGVLAALAKEWEEDKVVDPFI